MSKLIALVFDEAQLADDIEYLAAGPSTEVAEPKPATALANLKTIEAAAKEGGVKIEDAVVVFRHPEGDMRIDQTRDMTARKGARRGAFWGLLVGLLLGGPVGGILGGLGLGAIYGRVVDHGIPDEFFKDVGQAVGRNKSAILLLIDEKDYERSIAYLRSFDARIYEGNVSDGAVETLEEAADHPQVARVVEDEYGTAEK
jgi:uncharacterized membrane protein